MLTIKILGAHCFNCVWLEQTTLEVLEGLLPPQAYQMIKVSEMFEIASYGVLRLPALVINEQVLCAGRLPKHEQIAGWIAEALKDALPDDRNAAGESVS